MTFAGTSLSWSLISGVVVGGGSVTWSLLGGCFESMGAGTGAPGAPEGVLTFPDPAFGCDGLIPTPRGICGPDFGGMAPAGGACSAPPSSKYNLTFL